MDRKASERRVPNMLRKEVRDWLANRTIPNVREVAQDLEDAGEDVRDLVKAIDELEALLDERPMTAPQRGEAKGSA